MSIPTSGELRIIIQMPGEGGGEDTANGEAASATNPQHENGASPNPKNGKNKNAITMQAATQAAIQVGKQAINASISTIGLSSGNMYAQARAQQTAQAITSVATLGVTFASGNPLLITTALAGMAISTVTELYTQRREREIANYEAEQYAKRIGYTVGRR